MPIGLTGVKGRSLRLNGSESFSFSTSNQVSNKVPGSLSMWLKPEGDFVFEVGSTTFISYNYSTRTCIFGKTDDNVSITRSAITSDWMHLAVVGGDNNSTFYLDGKSSSTSRKTLGELKTSNFIGLLDETHIFLPH